jgi:photosystem II stability/assembly factor-like uncharacterized protein
MHSEIKTRFVSLTVILLISLCSSLFAQQEWQALPAGPKQPFRNDDVFFLNAQRGWVVNVKGEVWITTNAGTDWTRITHKGSTSFRCVGFLDSLRGFAGNLGPGRWAPTTDTIPLYTTTDGGVTWLPIKNLSGPTPRGICGIRVIDDSTIVACGRIDGPAFFLKSADAGKSWQATNMNRYAGDLIDLSFINRDSGFAVGGTDSNDVISRCVILFTTNGGVDWRTAMTGADSGEHCWKIEKTKNNTYYVSIERSRDSDALQFIKSTDGGLNWSEHTVSTVLYPYSQGIGFVNDSIGWIGGHGGSLMTTDGGETFTPTSLIQNLNRMRFANDTLGYAVGTQVYKFAAVRANVASQPTAAVSIHASSIPNPFSKQTEIQFTIPREEQVCIEVFDHAGRWIRTLLNRRMAAGQHSAQFRVPSATNDAFICTISAGTATTTIRMVAKN